ncbi:HAD-like protein [Exidia glandulosa HHB12029]|uniref:HAD-like protein n=1 Tax=Exidia glandulosa HHB12029 TaxID=1314781 RepID=A0A165ESK6_EXIGL|nr:HAD-like protein [Exidia glandulosa HHB12029]
MWKDIASASAQKRLIAFDLFGTLLDTSSIAGALRSEGVADASSAAQLWRRYQLEYTWRVECMGSYIDFDECTKRSLAHAAPDLSAEAREEVMAAYAHLEAYDDVGSAIKTLAQEGKFDLVVFTNGKSSSSDTLAGTRKMVEAAVNGSPSLAPLAQYLFPPIVVDDESLRHYKPAKAAYDHVAKTFGRDAKDIWLISSNPFDIVGAKSAGWNAAWVDRAGEGWKDGLGQPDVVARSLVDLRQHIE